MTQGFDEPENLEPAPGRGRSRALIITGVVVVAAFFAVTVFARFYTDRLWFDDLGYGTVFTRLLVTKVALFLGVGLFVSVVVCANVIIAFRSRPLFMTLAQQANLDRYRASVTPLRVPIVLGLGVVLLLFAGTSGSSHWRSFMLWRNGGSFGTKDQFFNKDLGFFVFDLPWLHYVVDVVMAALVLAVLAAAVTHYLYAGIRLQAVGDRVSGAAQAQLSVLLGLFVLAKAADYWLDRYDLVSQSGGLITGMTYTDDNAVLPAKNILFGIALICAVLFFLNVWRRTWILPSVGAALLALSAVLMGLIWPGIVQQFQVKPNEPDKEASYIAKNIAATRTAYGLDQVTSVDYDENTAAVSAAAVAAQLSSLPIVDPFYLRRAFEQLQQARNYYTVAPVLDVDRYEIDGNDRALVLAARELDQSGLNASSQNWSNLHTVYTHGNGLIAAYANQLGTDDKTPATSNRERIAWAEGIDTGQDVLTKLDGGYRSQIYFGENSPSYSIVGKAKASDPDVEIGLSDSATADQNTTYEGKGGVPIGSTFRRLMYAIKFGEAKFLLSGRVNANSQVLYDRDPRARVEKVAPWLTVDDDAYPAIVDGKIVWIVDGYTSTDRYAGSQKESFATMTDDTRADTTPGLQAPPTDEINYMSNAVKATVDAYDGTVTLYEWDENDPILRAWESAFPGTVQPKSAIPAELKEHLRYPDDLFKVQRYQLARYHVTDPSAFYSDRNRWEVPIDPSDPTNSHLQPPYRLFAQATPGSGPEDVWSLTSVFVPNGKANLAAYLSVNSDATSPDYGKMQVLEIPGEGVDGPGLIASNMASDAGVNSKLLKFQRNSTNPPVFGNLLTLPVDNGLVFIEPVYAASLGSDAGYPILQYVIVSFRDSVGIGTTLSEAVSDAIGASGSTGGGDGDGSGNGSGNGSGDGKGDGNGGSDLPVATQIRDLLDRADTAFAAANKALREGDLATYQKQIKRAQSLVARALVLADRTGATSSGAASSSPTASPSAKPSASSSASSSPSPSASPTD